MGAYVTDFEDGEFLNKKKKETKRKINTISMAIIKVLEKFIDFRTNALNSTFRIFHIRYIKVRTSS